MTKVEVLDDHYYALSAIVTVCLQLSCFGIAYTCSFDKITDLAGSVNFIILGVLGLVLNGSFFQRQVVVTILIVVARLELAVFLFYRVMKRKKDARFDEMRENFWAFLGFWVFQIFWVYVTMLPIIFLNGESVDPPVGPLDYASWAVWGVGFFIQVVADVQKYKFRANPDNNGKFCNVGLWSMSRHPNYYGEIMMWWAIFFATLPVVMNSPNVVQGYIGMLSPVFTMLLLLFLSGLPFAEGANLKRYYKNDEMAAEWERYRDNVSPVIVLPQVIYRNTPGLIKWLFCCEYSFLKYKSDGKLDESTPI